MWSGQGQGDSSGIFGQRYDSAGNAVGGEFLVNSYTTYGAGTVSAAAAADGAFVVVWAGTGDSGPGVFGRRYDSEGVPKGDQFRVNAITTDEFQRHPSIAAAANGNFVVVWQSYTGSFDQILGQRFDSEGAALGAEFHLGFVGTTVSVASDASGNFVVVWDGLHDSYESGIHGQRYDSEGIPQGDVFVVNSYEDAYQYRPSVASDASGNFVVVWDDDRASLSIDVFGRRFDNGGVAQGDDFPINSRSNNFVHDNPSIGATGFDQFAVVWKSGGGQDGSGQGVFGRRVAALPSLSISDVSVTEGNMPTPITTSATLARFTVTLSAPSALPVTTAYATANGTAMAPSDYGAKSGVLTLSPGQTSGVIYVVVKKDNLNEDDETFFVNLTNPTNSVIADGQGVGTIMNDDP